MKTPLGRRRHDLVRQARPARSHGTARGQALVEFSLIIVVALVLLMAVLDLGRAVYGLTTLSNATREGGRTAIVNQYLPDIRSRTSGTAFALGVDSSAVSCSTGTATSPSTPTGASGVCVDFRSPDMSTTCSAGSIGCMAVVTAKWTYTPLTPLIGQFVGPLPLVSTTKVPVESSCAISGCPIP